MRKLATALGCRMAWLHDGSSPWREQTVEADNVPENLRLAAEFARRSGEPEEAIRDVLTSTDFSGAADWTPADWLDEIKAAKRRRKRGADVGHEVDELDEPPKGA